MGRFCARLAFILCWFAVSCCTTGKTPSSNADQKRPPVKPSPKIPNHSSGIAWLDSERLMPVLEVAQRQKKVVFVTFFAHWCAPCKVMEEEVFSQPTAYEFINQRFLAFRTDFDTQSGRTLSEIYEVSTLPTVLFLHPNGVVLARKTGMLTLTNLQMMGDSVLAKFK